ncbi:MAG: helix-turn-helix domain-containing protein [Candidatus Omnitrophica bacterium]|nr:helix-turn-helix domain-containing protein [Candidatus Omnitrophota bacterium]
MMKLRALLEKHRVTIIELAAESGLPSGYLEKIEVGSILPTDEDKKRIFKAFKRIEARLQEPDDTPDDY